MRFVEDGGVRKVKMSEYSVDSGRHIGIGSDGRDASIDPSTPDGRRTSSGRGRSRCRYRERLSRLPITWDSTKDELVGRVASLENKSGEESGQY